MLHVISARCVVCDLDMIAHGPLGRTRWRWFAAQGGECKKISNCVFECDYYYYCYCCTVQAIKIEFTHIGSLKIFRMLHSYSAAKWILVYAVFKLCRIEKHLGIIIL